MHLSFASRLLQLFIAVGYCICALRSAPSSRLLLFPSYEVAPRSDSEESESDYEEEVCGHLSLCGVQR